MLERSGEAEIRHGCQSASGLVPTRTMYIDTRGIERGGVELGMADQDLSIPRMEDKIFRRTRIAMLSGIYEEALLGFEHKAGAGR